MTPEIYIMGMILAVITALLGVIWKQLNNKIDRLDANIDLSDSNIATQIAKAIQVTVDRFADQIGQLNSRIDIASSRMDRLQNEASALKVKLAEEYHNAAAVRTLTNDLLEPIKQQLNRIEHILEK